MAWPTPSPTQELLLLQLLKYPHQMQLKFHSVRTTAVLVMKLPTKLTLMPAEKECSQSMDKSLLEKLLSTTSWDSSVKLKRDSPSRTQPATLLKQDPKVDSQLSVLTSPSHALTLMDLLISKPEIELRLYNRFISLYELLSNNTLP